MPLTWTLDAGPATTMVTVDGQPTEASMTALREGLAACVTRRPAPLLISMSALAATRPEVLPELVGLAGRTGTPMVLRSEQRQPGVPLIRALSAARQAVLGERTTGGEQLLPVTGAARRSRDLATECCVRGDRLDLVAPAAVVASELTTYAAGRAGTLMTLSFEMSPGALHIALQHGPPAADTAGELELHVVNTVATCWGVLPYRGDTVLWATVTAGSPQPVGPALARVQRRPRQG